MCSRISFLENIYLPIKLETRNLLGLNKEIFYNYLEILSKFMKLIYKKYSVVCETKKEYSILKSSKDEIKFCNDINKIQNMSQYFNNIKSNKEKIILFIGCGTTYVIPLYFFENYLFEINMSKLYNFVVDASLNITIYFSTFINKLIEFLGNKIISKKNGNVYILNENILIHYFLEIYKSSEIKKKTPFFIENKSNILSIERQIKRIKYNLQLGYSKKLMKDIMNYLPKKYSNLSMKYWYKISLYIKNYKRKINNELKISKNKLESMYCFNPKYICKFSNGYINNYEKLNKIIERYN